MNRRWLWFISSGLALLLFGLAVPWPEAGASGTCGPTGQLPVTILARPGTGHPFLPLDDTLGNSYIDPNSYRTMVPLRALVTAVSPYDPDAIRWDSSNRTALVRYAGKAMSITYSANSDRAYSLTVNGQSHAIHTFICQGRIYAPARYISEVLGLRIDYFEDGIVVIDPVTR